MNVVTVWLEKAPHTRDGTAARRAKGRPRAQRTGGGVRHPQAQRTGGGGGAKRPKRAGGGGARTARKRAGEFVSVRGEYSPMYVATEESRPTNPARNPFREEAYDLIDRVLDEAAHGPPIGDLRELLSLCLEVLDRERKAGKAQASKAAKVAEKARVADERAAKAAAAAAAKDASAADAALEKANAAAEARARDEERAAREAEMAAQQAAEARARAEEAAERASSAAAELEMERAQPLQSDEQIRLTAAAEARADKAKKERDKADDRRRRAEERELRTAERLAEKAREKAAAARDVARAADALAARMRELGSGGGGLDASAGAGGVAPVAGARRGSASGLTPASNIAAQRLRRASDRIRQPRAGAGGTSGGDTESSLMIRYDDPDAVLPTSAAEALEAERQREEAERDAVCEDDSTAGAGEDYGVLTVISGDAPDERGAGGGDATVFDGMLSAEADAWASWSHGGSRKLELAGYMTQQSDCVSVTAASDGHHRCVCIGGDGASDGRCVTVYSLADGAAACHLHGHAEQVMSVACDGDVIASGSSDGEIRIWRRPCESDGPGGSPGASEDAYIASLSNPGGGAVYGLAMRGDMLFSGEATGPTRMACARLWSVRTRRIIKTFSEHKGNIWSVALGHGSSESLALSGCRDGTAKVWPTDSAAKQRALSTLKHPELVCSVSMSAGLAATACHDKLVRLWCLDTASPAAYTCTHTIEHDKGVKLGGLAGGEMWTSGWISVRVAGGALITGGGETGSVRLWALRGAAGAESALTCITTLSHGQAVRGVACSDDTGTIVSAGGRHTASGVVVWSATPARESATRIPSAQLPSSGPRVGVACASIADAGESSMQLLEEQAAMEDDAPSAPSQLIQLQPEGRGNTHSPLRRLSRRFSLG